MSDVLDRLRADNPFEAGSAPSIDEVWARLQRDPAPAQQQSRIPGSAVALTLSVIVALAIAALAVGLLGHHRQTNRSLLSPPSLRTPSKAGAMPTLAQLKANFTVLRRPQTAADRSWAPPKTAVPGLTRLAQRLAANPGTALAYPVRLFTTVKRGRTHGEQPSGSYRLDLYAVASNGNVAHVPFAPDVDYTVFPLDVLQRYGGGWMLWAGVVPDGVSRVRWHFGCSPHVKGCLKPAHWTVDIPVRGNTAAAAVANTGPCAQCGQPQAVTWYGAHGRVIASYSHAAKRNLTAPPFVNANPPAPLAGQRAGVKVLGYKHAPGQAAAQRAAQARPYLRQAARNKVDPALIKTFHLLRQARPLSVSAQITVAAAIYDLAKMGSSYGANPSRAGETTVGPGKAKVWLVPGSTGACLVDVEGPQGAGSGCNRASDVEAGDSWTLDTIPYGAGGARSKVLLGAAPDGNTSVTVSWADGGATVVPVTDNIYCVPIGSHTGWKSITLKDSRDDVVGVRGMPRLP